MRFFKTTFAAMAVSLAGLAPAHATSVSPSFETFGPLTTLSGGAVTFGGSGIPTDPAVIRDFDLGGGATGRIGMIATPRFSSPTPGNDGKGTYSALPGESDPALGLWNFSFFLEADNGLSLTSDLAATLYYDLDPKSGTRESKLGVIDLSFATFVLTGGNPAVPVIQGSQNLGFGYLGTSAPGLRAPAITAYDPLLRGEYSFILEVSNTSASSRVAMNVNVAPAPIPLPAAGWMLVAGLAGLVGVRRRKRAV